jgi:hypothetical protein
LVETAEQAKQATAMVQVLLNDAETYDLLYDFGERYVKAMHPLDIAEYGLKAASVIITIIASIAAMIYSGGTSGAGSAGKLLISIKRLREASPIVDKIYKALKYMAYRYKLPKLIEKGVSKVKRRRTRTKGKGGVPEVEAPDKIDKNRKKGYSDDDEGPKKKGPKDFTIDKNKHKYFFGEVDPPSPSLKETNPKKYKKLKHNYDRSQQIKKELEKVDIHNNDAGRKKLFEIFDEAAKSPPINKHEGPFGKTLTKSTTYKGTKFDVKFFYESGNMAKRPKVVTLIPKS